jgi:hypothetical protein
MPGLPAQRVNCLNVLILGGSDAGALTTGSVAQPRIKSSIRRTEKPFVLKTIVLFIGVLPLLPLGKKAMENAGKSIRLLLLYPKIAGHHNLSLLFHRQMQNRAIQ